MNDRSTSTVTTSTVTTSTVTTSTVTTSPAVQSDDVRSDEPGSLRLLAERVVTEAVAHLRDLPRPWEQRADHGRGSPGVVAGVSTKSTPTDVVTASDTALEALVRERLAQLRPGDPVVGEEAGGTPEDGVVTWVVDPVLRGAARLLPHDGIPRPQLREPLPHQRLESGVRGRDDVGRGALRRHPRQPTGQPACGVRALLPRPGQVAQVRDGLGHHPLREAAQRPGVVGADLVGMDSRRRGRGGRRAVVHRTIRPQAGHPAGSPLVNGPQTRPGDRPAQHRSVDGREADGP